MPIKHQAKISFVLLSTLMIALLIPLGIYLVNFDLSEWNFLMIGIWLLFLFFILHMFLGTSYTITKDKLYIKSGFIKYPTIAIASIKSIEETKSIYSSPAPSFDRIRINYEKYSEVIVSPRDKAQFIKDLQKINPTITYNK
ncbi:PH domain-containing protein [Marivirga atlantica]|jgi:hypothetical protein|nr:PH domain-containing protein [Marivirga atlantica]